MTIAKLVLLTFVIGGALVSPVTSLAKTSGTAKTVQTTFTGYISDNHCGLKHMEGMESDKACVLMCVTHGKFVLADRDHKKVYQLDKVGQQKALDLAGQKVKITGRRTGQTIRVVTIQAV